jgi:hypothetical protein
MLCEVYPIRENGRRLRADLVRQRRVVGWLSLTERMPSGAPETRATVSDDDGRELLTALCVPRVRRIERGGLLISGYLDNGRGVELVRQAWWCVPMRG